MTNPICSSRRGSVLGALACAILISGTMMLAQQDAALNSIQSIKTAQAGGVDIAITSTTGFLQSDVPVLRIGDQEFMISRYPEDGSANTLIFTLTAEEFDRTRTGDKVTFQYGRGDGRNHRDFGLLDKTRRDK